MWEDPSNTEGGKWVLTLPKARGAPPGTPSAARDAVDEVWFELLYAVVGEQLPPSKDVCGVVVSIRKQQDRVAVWTRNYADQQSCVSIGYVCLCMCVRVCVCVRVYVYVYVYVCVMWV